MDLFSVYPPSWCVVHEKHMVSFAYHLAHFILWTVTGGGSFFIQQLFDDPAICEDDCCCCPKFETEHTSICLCPLCEPMSVSHRIGARNLLEV